MNQRLGSDIPSTTALSDDLRRLGQDTKDVANRAVETGRRKVMDMGDQVSGYVREQPVTCMAVAAGAGILLGYLFGRRR
ncbi:MAG TPA: hypothetical protein VJS92_04570 [Candidatus Polarisedimenticolaceae bacterium]|nr:hypothetical protein [Candidatus Polarisedimenticolaceae bacterium]